MEHIVLLIPQVQHKICLKYRIVSRFHCFVELKFSYRSRFNPSLYRRNFRHLLDHFFQVGVLVERIRTQHFFENAGHGGEVHVGPSEFSGNQVAVLYAFVEAIQIQGGRFLHEGFQQRFFPLGVLLREPNRTLYENIDRITETVTKQFATVRAN